MKSIHKRPSRLLVLPLVILFLLEAWVWHSLVAFAQFLFSLLPWDRWRDAARHKIESLPVIVAVLFFGIPVIIAEGGAFISIVLAASGHIFAGVWLYICMKIFALLLVPAIFDITRNKLLALHWFAWLYEKMKQLHALATRFVQPYREAAQDYIARAVSIMPWSGTFRRRTLAWRRLRRLLSRHGSSGPSPPP